MADDSKDHHHHRSPEGNNEAEREHQQPANAYAPGRQRAGFVDALKAVKMEDFKTVHKKPCVRDALLYGIGSAFAFGGLKLVLGARIPLAANWAAGTFAGASLVTYEFCQFQREKERAGVLRVVEIIDRRKAEREKQIAEKKKLHDEKKAAEEEEARRKAARRWYKFW